jgi:RNA-binding protein YlmH
MEKDSEEKLIIARLLDKIRLCKTKNKIVNTEFLNLYQINTIQKKLDELREKNYIFFGGYEGAASTILFFYPDKFDMDIVNTNIYEAIKAIKIKLPNEVWGKYKHGDYLSSVLKLGLERQRIGDIIVHDDGAYILVLNENAEYIKSSLEELTRYKKAEIGIINIDEIKIKETEFENIRIVVSSLRLDNVVANTSNISRSKAEEIILSERIFINGRVETKCIKIVCKDDILTIRGKGKFIIDNISENKKGKFAVEIRKYK